jgi:hypothetical protein
VVQTCHAPLESLNFSGSFSAIIYFLNQIFVKTKLEKKEEKKLIKKIKMAVTDYATTVRYSDIYQKNR